MHDVTSRWRLNRAGILNVYQYGNETLQFGGGRLLLRGVNGSGKSTAMNMLLPFLIDADTRRIDAAGEQSAVLRSWMLSGREEQQPVGYLWIEFARAGDEPEQQQYLVCGCGIKANRSTDRVTTWWFVTDRRPGVDLALMEGRVPLSVDVLRSELGPHAVFAQDQRAGYRQAIRDALFGGGDLDQHIRLLHIVRSPRVGDRIDTELPAYLRDALPQLSEAAIDDAAQPLEDLEEHRRNVQALARTSGTLQSLIQVYRGYASGELLRRASDLTALSDDVGRHRKEAARRRQRADEAGEQLHDAEHRIQSITADIARLAGEIKALEATPAYQQGIEFDDLRDHVISLKRRIGDARQRSAAEDKRRQSAAESVRGASTGTAEDHRTLHDTVTELAGSARSVRLAVGVPDLPGIATEELEDSINVPIGEVTIEPLHASIGSMKAAMLLRRGDVDEVLAAIERIDARRTDLVNAEHDHERARDDTAAARQDLDRQRHALADAVDAWRSDLHGWLDELVVEADDAEIDRSLVETPELLDRRSEVVASWFRAASELVDRRQAAHAEVAARRQLEQAEVDRLAAELAEQLARSYPDPPAAPWQRTDRRACLADLIDFADHVTEADRIGLEAALEASGLLGAELGIDGALHLASGDLFVSADQQVDAPLSDLLTVTVPESLQPEIDPGIVTKVLDSISTDIGAAADTVATMTGEFRVGALHGRHTKSEAEHVGVTARRAAIERRRAITEQRLAEATDVVRTTDEELAARQAHIERLKSRRDTLPTTNHLDVTHGLAQAAAERLDDASLREAEASRRVQIADDAHAAAVTEATRVAATHQLPMDHQQLMDILKTLDLIGTLCRDATTHLDVFARSHRNWHARADDWRTAREAAELATQQVTDAETEHRTRAMRLATLEDAIGTEYQEMLASLEVSRADLNTAEIALAAARDAEKAAIQGLTNARRDSEEVASALEGAHARCVAAIDPMRRALAVPGLLDAALDAEVVDTAQQPSVPPVEDTPEGARALAVAVTSLVARSGWDAITPDGVRQSLRQRREQLGAGWDAEDHQPDDTLPISISVTGPLGRMPLPTANTHVRTQLGQQSSLLTAKQDQALRNLLQGLVAREVAEKMHAAGELIGLMNQRLENVSTAHGIGARLTWKRRSDLDGELTEMIDLLRRPPDLRTADHDAALAAALSTRIERARGDDPERRYRDLIAEILDYRDWHEIGIVVRRAGRDDERLTRRTPLSEGEKKIVSYLPLFAAVAGSYDALAESEPAVPRFVLLDDAFAKVSEDNHAQLFGLLVEFDLDFIATSERLWGTHATVPELAITEVLRDAALGVIVLEHSRWDGKVRTEDP